MDFKGFVAGLQSSELDELQNQGIQFLGILLNDRGIFTDIIVGGRICEYSLARSVNQCEWRTKFVSHVGEKTKFGFI